MTCELDNAVAATVAAATRIISENANQNQNENTLLQRDALLMIAYMKNTRSSKKKCTQKKGTQETGLKVAKVLSNTSILNGLHPGIPK